METYFILTYVFNGLSVSSCVLVILLYIFVKEIHSFPAELTMYLIGSITFFNITYFIPVKETHSPLCQFQGVIALLFDLCSIVWIAVISYVTYFSVTNIAKIQQRKIKLRIIFYILSLIPAIIVALLSYFLGAIQYFADDKYCWYKFSYKGNYHYESSIIMGIIYYIIVWFIIFVNIYFVVALIIKIKGFKLENKKLVGYSLKLLRYPIIQLISYTPNTIIGLIEMIANDYDIIPGWFVYIQMILESLCGFFYVVAFFYNKDLIGAVKRFICREKGNKNKRNKISINEEEMDNVELLLDNDDDNDYNNISL